MSLLEKLRRIKVFAMDVDGVLTNGSLIVLPDGQLLRTMNVKDGYALQLAVKNGFEVMVISGGDSEGAAMRLKNLGIENVHMKCKNKSGLLTSFVEEKGYDWNEVAFLGDDIPDLACMKMAGLACCPADAVTEIKNVSEYISGKKGGEGFVREVIEKVMKLAGKWDGDLSTASA